MTEAITAFKIRTQYIKLDKLGGSLSLLLFIFLGLCTLPLQAQNITIDFSKSSPNQIINAPAGITVSEVEVSSGSISYESFGTTFDGTPAAESSGNWMTTTDPLDAKHFFFTIQAEPGYSFDLTDISSLVRSTAAGPSGMALIVGDDIINTVSTPNQATPILSVSGSGLSDYNNLTELTIKIAGYDDGSRNSTGSGDARIGEIEGSVTVNEATLIASPDELSGFTYPEGFGPSASQSFILSAVAVFEETVIIQAPSSFEVSLDNSDFNSTATIPDFSGEETEVFVRLANGLDEGPQNGQLLIEVTGGAENINVDLSGEVTEALPLIENFNVEYQENFSGFVSAATIPDGWSINSTGNVESYQGDWGTGAAGGLRGNANVLGYQHSGDSGIFTITLSLINNTGTTIRALDVSYEGKVERETQPRHPEWTVTVAGQEVAELAYSTGEGVDQTRESVVPDIEIPDGQVFTLTWESERGSNATGSSRQIGISDVSVTAIVAEPILSLDAAAGPFIEDQSVFITNFNDYAETDIRFTLDGNNPDGQSDLYNNETGILLEDGNGPLTLKVIAIQDESIAVSSIAEAEYEFPFNIVDIEALRDDQLDQSGETLYRLTNESTLIGQTTFRNTRFFQDNSGFGIQIDDDEGTITTSYNIGDNVGSLIGRLIVFQGQIQLIPEVDSGEPISSGNFIAPEPVTLADIDDDFQSRLIVVEELEFDDTGNFGTGPAEEDITGPGGNPDNVRFRNIFVNVNDIEGSPIPEEPVNLTGVVQRVAGGLRIGPRNLLDIDPVAKALSIGDASEPAAAQQGWRFISSPVEGATYSQIFENVRTQGVGEGSSYINPAADPNIITLNQNQQYVAFNSGDETLTLSSEMPAGTAVGIYLFDRYNPDQPNSELDGFPKEFLLNGLQHYTTVSLGTEELNQGNNNFSIAGNPFNATIRFGELSRDQISPVVYAYDSTDGFISYSSEMEAGDLTDGLLGPFQGFFVSATGESPGLSISADARTTDPADPVFRTPTEQLRIKFAASFHSAEADTLRSSFWLGTHPEGGDSHTPSIHDALRLFPLDYRPFLSLYTVSAERALSIKSLSDDVLITDETTLPLLADAWKPGTQGYEPAAGSVTLTWPQIDGLPAGYQVLLEDRQTGISINIAEEESYTFELNPVASRTAAERDVSSSTASARSSNNLLAFNSLEQLMSGKEVSSNSELTSLAEDSRLRIHLLSAPLEISEPDNLPVRVQLEQNYPNPFNPSTTLRYALSEAGQVQLDVFNIQGQHVVTLVNEIQSPGIHQVVWNAVHMASGLYLYRLKAEGKVLTKSMVLVK